MSVTDVLHSRRSFHQSFTLKLRNLGIYPLVTCGVLIHSCLRLQTFYGHSPIEQLWDAVEPENVIMDLQETNIQHLWCDHVSVDENLSGLFPAPWWIYGTKTWSTSEGKRGPIMGLAWYLIKWPVRVDLLNIISGLCELIAWHLCPVSCCRNECLCLAQYGLKSSILHC